MYFLEAVDYLIEWTNDVNWKKYVLGRVIGVRGNLDIEEMKKELLDIILTEREIELEIQKSDSNKSELNLRINSIKRPVNINALSEDSEFSLGRNLNVFYGENGTGKSSYVRVFRKLANNYFTNQKKLVLHPNVYKDCSEGLKQTLEITYEVNQNVKIENIDINKPNSYLKNINVFDSDSVVPLLNEDLSFSILPQGFSYFRDIIEILDKLKKSIEQDILNYDMEIKGIFKDSSFQIVKDELLDIQKEANSSNFQGYIKKNYPQTEHYETKLKEIEIQIKELTSTNVESSRKLLNVQKNKLESVNKAISQASIKLSEESLTTVNKLIDDFLTKVAEEKEHNEKFNKQISYLEKFNDQWLEFIKSGKMYYDSIEKSIPTELDHCIFCGQLLDENHIKKIGSNFEHINSTIIHDKEEIRRELLNNDIKELKIIFKDEDKDLIGKEILASKLQSAIVLINRNLELFSKGINESKVIQFSNTIDVSSLTQEIDKEIENIKARLSELSKSSFETANIVKGLENKRNVLLKAQLINSNVSLLEKWFRINDKMNQLSTLKKNFSTTALTKKAKEAFNDLVEENYIKTFKGYCQELKVRDVDVKLKPQKGKTYRSKYVSDEQFKITDIMSEGEQKAIAMAEFSTDLKIRKNYNTLIFDDPVTSLDYKRSENFAKLIYNLSKERQVLVFTHNILFYYFLYNQCESNNKENKFFKVDLYDTNNKGLVSESFSGRLENINDIKKKLNVYKQKIESKSCMGDELEYNISLAYTEIRTWCELIVEEGFFKNIVRRYEPNIRFTKLKEIDGSFVDELSIVSDLFDRSCRWMIGHSQPLETLYSKPSREDFFADFEYIKSLTNKFTTVKW